MESSPLEDLRRRFDIPGIAEIHRGPNGLPAVRVSSALAAGEMHLHGGHVTSWTPAGSEDVLFVSRRARYERGRAIRGGIPVCFPWFGALDGRPDAPAHGCVRTKSWQLDALDKTDAGVRVTMSTASDDDTRGYWPADFRLVNRVTFGVSLTVELTVFNTGVAPFTFEEALHTYYRVGTIHGVRVDGLDGVRYLDALDGLRERTQDDGIAFDSEVDRIYLGTARPILIDDTTLGRQAHLAADHSQTTVVWNPWIRKAQTLGDLDDEEWRDFVCVETCNVSPLPVPLVSGAAHTLRLVVRLSGPTRLDAGVA